MSELVAVPLLLVAVYLVVCGVDALALRRRRRAVRDLPATRYAIVRYDPAAGWVARRERGA